MSKKSSDETGWESPDRGPKRNKTEEASGQASERDSKCEGEPRRLMSDAGTELDPKELNRLGKSHIKRFRRFGELDDLEKAVEYGSRALELTPDSHEDWSLQLADLGAFYGERFTRLGELEDLEKSIELQSRAIALTPDGHPDLARRHDGLGVSYTLRFRRLGELDNLEKALEHKSHALKLTPDGHPHLARRHDGLGVSYSVRFQRLGELDNLEKALEHFSHALKLTPDGHPDLAHRHHSLGVSYTLRFQRLGQLDDLEKALEHVSHALKLTPDGHPDLAPRHARLGVSYTHRFRRLGELDNLEKAIKHGSSALTLTPDGHPDLSPRHFNLARYYFNRYQQTHNPSHFQESLHSFRRASHILTGAPRAKFNGALQWAALASKHPSLQCIEAYQVAIDLLPQFIWLGATTNQRYQDLSTAESLAVKAACAAILHSGPILALQWLEHTRCVVWNQSLMLRSPLDQLRLSYPDLAARLETVSKQLHDAGSELPTSQAPSSGSVDPEQAGRHRRRLAKEYDELLAQARGLPNYEDFLRPMKANALVRAARYGPLVVINCHEARCDALLVLPQGGIEHLHLANFTEEKARNARSEIETSPGHQRQRERGVWTIGTRALERKDRIGSVLAVLWRDIVKPVLDSLGYTNNVPANNLPHITWCPTGLISFLPLHAAGDYDRPGSRVFDYVVSSYTPTLTALLASTPSSLNPASRVLAIGQANTPGCNQLPGTTRELGYVKDHMHNKAGYSQFVGEQATTEAVLDAMEQHDWVHLACHAHQNRKDPTKSGFYLHNGTLDLSSINRRSFKNKGLAFLSACSTATGDKELPDEAIHLASGMLMAGYPSVIATMWGVMDDDAPLVADKVYAELMKDGRVGNGEAGKALHYAVAALRDKVGEKAFGRWVPYIHIGS